MKTILISVACTALFSGCAMGPSPEAKSREIEQERQADRQQSEFRKGLPPDPTTEHPSR